MIGGAGQMTDDEMKEEILALLSDHGIRAAKKSEDKLVKVFMLGMNLGWMIEMDADFEESEYGDELERYRKEGLI